MNPLWTTLVLQAICIVLLLIGMIANYVRVLKLRTDLVHHRTNLERSMNHVEADLAALRVAFVEESNHPPGVGS